MDGTLSHAPSAAAVAAASESCSTKQTTKQGLCCGPCRKWGDLTSSPWLTVTRPDPFRPGGFPVQVPLVHRDDARYLEPRSVCGACKRTLRRHFSQGSEPHRHCHTVARPRCLRMLSGWRVQVTLPNGKTESRPLRFIATSLAEVDQLLARNGLAVPAPAPATVSGARPAATDAAANIKTTAPPAPQLAASPTAAGAAAVAKTTAPPPPPQLATSSTATSAADAAAVAKPTTPPPQLAASSTATDVATEAKPTTPPPPAAATAAAEEEEGPQVVASSTAADAAAEAPPHTVSTQQLRGVGLCCGPCCHLTPTPRPLVTSPLFAVAGGVQVIHPDDIPYITRASVCGSCKDRLCRHFGVGKRITHVHCKEVAAYRCVQMLNQWRIHVPLPNGEVETRPMRFVVTTARELQHRIAEALRPSLRPAGETRRSDECWGPCGQNVPHRPESALFHNCFKQPIHPADVPFIKPGTMCHPCKVKLRRHFGKGTQPHHRCIEAAHPHCVRMLSQCRVWVPSSNGGMESRPVRFVATTAREWEQLQQQPAATTIASAACDHEHAADPTAAPRDATTEPVTREHEACEVVAAHNERLPSTKPVTRERAVSEVAAAHDERSQSTDSEPVPVAAAPTAKRGRTRDDDDAAWALLHFNAPRAHKRQRRQEPDASAAAGGV